jgi:hypothetical protein
MEVIEELLLEANEKVLEGEQDEARKLLKKALEILRGEEHEVVEIDYSVCARVVKEAVENEDLPDVVRIHAANGVFLSAIGDELSQLKNIFGRLGVMLANPPENEGPTLH